MPLVQGAGPEGAGESAAATGFQSETLRADDFEASYRQRKQRLLDIIEPAMGKSCC
jgi:hypothetical protein